MAHLQIVTDDVSTTRRDEIARFLRDQGIEFGTHVLTPLARDLVAKDVLSDEERAGLLASYAPCAERYAKGAGFRSDVVCFWPTFEHMNFVLEKFSPIHFHFENEWWYLVDGQARFGFLGSAGTKFVVTVDAGELLQVPEGMWQWFELTPAKRMKSIRYFNTSHGIAPRTPVKFESPVLAGQESRP